MNIEARQYVPFFEIRYYKIAGYLEVKMTDDELILLAAFRYALGRRTYIVHTIAEYLKKVKTSVIFKRKIIQEIEEAENKGEYIGDLGDDCDRRDWISLKEYFQRSIKD